MFINSVSWIAFHLETITWGGAGRNISSVLAVSDNLESELSDRRWQRPYLIFLHCQHPYMPRLVKVAGIAIVDIMVESTEQSSYGSCFFIICSAWLKISRHNQLPNRYDDVPYHLHHTGCNNTSWPFYGDWRRRKEVEVVEEEEVIFHIL